MVGAAGSEPTPLGDRDRSDRSRRPALRSASAIDSVGVFRGRDIRKAWQLAATALRGLWILPAVRPRSRGCAARTVASELRSGSGAGIAGADDRSAGGGAARRAACGRTGRAAADG